MIRFNPGFEIQPTLNPLGFEYGIDCFGPQVEKRDLNSIRKSLLDPECNGLDPVYVIAMDVGKLHHKSILLKKNLIFGAVTYAAGRLGNEPVRSQGHVHKKSRNNKISSPEIYEIWSGKAIIYMQESVSDNPGRCFAVEAGVGEKVIVPPDWGHATISADIKQPLTFGAWCDREYGFEYKDVRDHGGLAWFPILNESFEINWNKNKNYYKSELICKKPEKYERFGIDSKIPIYTQFENDQSLFQFVSDPELKSAIWKNFTP